MPASTTRDALFALLDEVDFPADKSVLVDAATRNGAEDETIRAPRGIPPVDCRSMDEVLRSVSLADSSDAPPPHAQEAARREHTHPGLSESSKDVPRDR